MNPSNTEVNILVNSSPIKKFSHQNKVFVIAKHNNEYVINIKNNSWSKKLAVVSVDGINVIDEKAAGSSLAGYIVNGYSSIQVKGFRTSLEEIHPFKFSTKEKSYAAQSEQTQGDTSNCGVIGVQIFNEKPEILWSFTSISNIYQPEYSEPKISNEFPVMDYGTQTRSLAATSCNGTFVCNSQPVTKTVDFDMGTEFSPNTSLDVASEVLFKIGILEETFTIYYASYGCLKAIGVPLSKEVSIAFPNPFPSRFCQPPKKY